MDLDNLIIGKTKERRKIIEVGEKSSRIRTRVEQQLALVVD
jgi:hypothetical protein